MFVVCVSICASWLLFFWQHTGTEMDVAGEIKGNIFFDDGPKFCQMQGGLNTEHGVEPGQHRFSGFPMPHKLIGAVRQTRTVSSAVVRSCV